MIVHRGGDPSLAIACESGGFRCVFVHGVLDALELAGVRAGTYAAASASVLPAAFAAVGLARDPGVAYWHDLLEVRMRPGNGMSEMVLAGIEKYLPDISEQLLGDAAPRFAVTASEVVDPAAAEATQGMLATRLGREQLLAMAREDDSWARAALRAAVFDSRADDARADDAQADDTCADGARRLTIDNIDEVAYASSRMLHAWRIPATIDGRAYIDASYTVGFPVAEALTPAATRVVAIATGAGAAFRNLYRTEPIGETVNGAHITLVAPEYDLKDLGVDFTTATNEGIGRVYEHGREMGGRLLEKW